MNVQTKADSYKKYITYGLGTSFIGGGLIALVAIVYHYLISKPNVLNEKYSDISGLQAYQIGSIGFFKYNKFQYDKDYQEWDSSVLYKYVLYASAVIFFAGLIPALIGLIGLLRNKRCNT